MPPGLAKSLLLLTTAAVIAIAVSTQTHWQALEVFGTAILIGGAAVLSAYTLLRDADIPDLDELQRYVRWTRDFLLLFVLMGAFSILAFCLQHLYPDQRPRNFFGSLGAGLLLSLASLAIGGVLGFIFGVPRALRENADRDYKGRSSFGGAGLGLDDSAQGERSSPQTIRVNTNLEEISDWLTKIIVGVGLTQLTNMPRFIQEFVSFVTPSCGPNCAYFGPSISFTISAFFSCCGFLLAYLLTRLFLQRPFAMAGEINAKIAVVLRAAEVEAEKTSAGAPPQAARVEAPVTDAELDRARNLQKLSIGPIAVSEQLDRLAIEYEGRRATMPSGFERTSAMEQIAAQMKALGLSVPTDLLRTLTESTSSGHRLAAVMSLQIAPRPEYIEWLGSRIENERPFIGYQASRSLRSASRALDKNSLPLLEQTIEVAIKTVPQDSDRYRELKAALEDVQSAKG